MPYLGKIIGTVAGLASGRPWIALLGFILGHQFDRGFADRFAGLGRDGSSAYFDVLPDGFIRTLFQTLGHLAKADGRVTEDEIRATRALMHRLNLKPEQIRQAVNWFESGKPRSFPLLQSMQQLRQEYARKAEQRVLFLHLVMEVLLAKSAMHRSERALIWAICRELDIGRVELAQMEAMLRAQRGFRKSPQGDADATRLDNAYRVLGVNRSASNEEVKRAYRRLMNKNHPDKLVADNPDSNQIAEAERKTREVRVAYEMLKARRSIR